MPSPEPKPASATSEESDGVDGIQSGNDTVRCPDGWRSKDLGSLFEFKNGLNKAKGFFGRGTPIINYMDVYDHPGIVREHVNGLVDLDAGEIKNFSANPGDVFFTRTSETLEEIGMAAVLLEEIPGAVFSGFVLRGRPKTDELTNSFKKYCFRSEAVRQQIVSSGTYTTRALTNGRNLSKVTLIHPILREEQLAIGSALSDTDALIEGMENLIAKKRLVKEGAMQELLTGERRLPGFSGEWQKIRLEDIGEVVNGLTYSPRDVREDGTLVLRASNIQGGSLAFDDNVYVQMDVPDRALVREDDILVCVRNGSRDLIGKFAKIDGRCSGMAFGAFMAVFRTSAHEFVAHQFGSDRFKAQIRAHLGATINQITNKSFNSFEIDLPSDPEEQRAIGRVLSEMDSEVATLRAKLAKLRLIKQGMMQELLTGRIRLI